MAGVKAGIKAGAKAGREVETQEKALKIDLKESLLLVKALGRVSASLLSTRLTNRGFPTRIILETGVWSHFNS